MAPHRLHEAAGVLTLSTSVHSLGQPARICIASISDTRFLLVKRPEAPPCIAPTGFSRNTVLSASAPREMGFSTPNPRPRRVAPRTIVVPAKELGSILSASRIARIASHACPWSAGRGQDCCAAPSLSRTQRCTREFWLGDAFRQTLVTLQAARLEDVIRQNRVVSASHCDTVFSAQLSHSGIFEHLRPDLERSNGRSGRAFCRTV